MKIHTKRILAAILSTGVIASTLGATLTSAAADVKVSMMQNTYINQYFSSANRYEYVYMAKAGTEKSGRYFNQYETNYYNNVVKAANYFKGLGFNYCNYSALLYYSNGPRTPYTPDTVYISYTYDNGKSGSNTMGRYGYANLEGTALSEIGMITLGPVDSTIMYDFAYVPDVLAHEYVHLMTQQIAGWDRFVRSSSNEAGAIVEAYSDILGECTETNPDWKMGTGAYKYNSNGTKCCRNLKAPKSTVTPGGGNITYYTNYNDFKKVKNKSFSNDIAYGGSTVLSYAAYLMTTSGLNKDLVAQFWYDSISLFPNKNNPTMSNCRKAVVQAVNNYADRTGSSARGRSELISRVNWAFNQVGIS